MWLSKGGEQKACPREALYVIYSSVSHWLSHASYDRLKRKKNAAMTMEHVMFDFLLIVFEPLSRFKLQMRLVRVDRRQKSK